jgi:hypothetical protein
MESKPMFQSLEEEIESSEGGHPKAIARLVRFVGIAVLSGIGFGGLYLVITRGSVKPRP